MSWPRRRLAMPTAMSVTPHGEAFGRRAVAPTLAAAGVGLLVGDLATASAILRPDYATGPGLGASALLLRDTALCATRRCRDPRRNGVRPACGGRRWSSSISIRALRPAVLRSTASKAITRIRSFNSPPPPFVTSPMKGRWPCWQPASRRAFLCSRSSRAIEGRASCSTMGPRASPSRMLAVSAEPPADSPLYLTVSGRTIGRIGFRRASRSRLAVAVGELRRQGGVAVGLLSDGVRPRHP